MNDSTLTALKILVERAVRPVRASMAHKQKVREELLAHVTTVFEEEAAQTRDERAALDRTEQRFGKARELTDQLQQAVSRRDGLRRLHESIFGFGSSQSTWRRSLRHALAAALMCAGVFGLVLILEAILFPASLRPWPILAAAASFITGLCVFVAGLLFLAHWMCDALYGSAGRAWLRAVPVAAASGLILPLVTFAICLLWSGDVWSSLSDVRWVCAVAMLLTPWIVSAIAWRLAYEIRAIDEWASLRIE